MHLSIYLLYKLGARACTQKNKRITQKAVYRVLGIEGIVSYFLPALDILFHQPAASSQHYVGTINIHGAEFAEDE